MRAAPAGAFDLVLLDPPFDAELLQPALAQAVRLLAGNGAVYVESGSAVAVPPEFEVWREGRTGAVHFTLLRRSYTAGVAPDRSAP